MGAIAFWTIYMGIHGGGSATAAVPKYVKLDNVQLTTTNVPTNITLLPGINHESIDLLSQQ